MGKKRDCPHFIVSTGGPSYEDEVFITVVDRHNFGLLRIEPSSVDWRIIHGEIEEMVVQRAKDWYYGVYLPYINNL